ncbi:MAG: PilT/PilU family type 4a pilus ATPase [Actinomycetota bacterium]
MVSTPSRQLGELLVERKVLSRDALIEALAAEAEAKVPLSTLLVRNGLVAEKDLLSAVAQQIGVPFADLDAVAPRPDLVKVISEDLAREHRAVALDLEHGELVVAMEDPGNAAATEAIAKATGYTIRAALAERGELLELLDQLHGPVEGGIAGSATDLHLDELLVEMVEKGGSDLHLTAGMPPAIRLNGEMTRLEQHPPLNGSEIRRLVYEVLTQKQRERFEEHLELDTSHSIPDKGRFRVNVFVQRNSVGAVMRAIPSEIVPFSTLNLPESVKQFAEVPRGLVLVTGPTGSGKSTTLASLLDVINESQTRHIMTVEDPIEFVHRHKRCVVNQREVGEDTHSFEKALKHVLRQDPDVILLGEMRDLETISTALTAAETGHLVFATLHTQDAPQSIDRMIDVFPPEQQQQVRVQLAVTLQGVVTQTLLKTRDGRGRVAACEILVAIPAVRNLIREGKAHQIYSTMQAGAKYGMQTMDQSLADLVKAGRIELDAAIEKCADEQNLRTLIGR